MEHVDEMAEARPPQVSQTTPAVVYSKTRYKSSPAAELAYHSLVKANNILRSAPHIWGEAVFPWADPESCLNTV